MILLFTLTFFLSWTSNDANKDKDYTAYYQQVIEAENLIASENYRDALQVYETLFENYSFVFLRDYQVATQLAILLKDEEKAIQFLKQGIHSGWEMKSIKKNKLLKKLRATKDWKALKKEYPKLHAEYEAQLNQALRKEVKQLFSKDQWKAMGALFRFTSKAQERYAEQKFAPHSEKQMATVRTILKKYGYAGEKLIGNDYWLSTIISHHNSITKEYAVRDSLYPNLKVHLKNALKNAQISPYEFALIDEWYRLTKTGKPAYGIIDIPTKEDLSRSNALRKTVYMRSIELRNQLIEVQAKTGIDLYTKEEGWIRGIIAIE